MTMTMDAWRRRLLKLELAVREARVKLKPGLDPLPAEQAYNALREAEAELERHYRLRPAHF
jgi:hypothetical protein